LAGLLYAHSLTQLFAFASIMRTHRAVAYFSRKISQEISTPMACRLPDLLPRDPVVSGDIGMDDHPSLTTVLSAVLERERTKEGDLYGIRGS
jgi:hypothetical protein